MKIKGERAEALFLSRPNRFSAVVEREGRPELVFLPNPGRLEELLLPGRQVFLARRPGPGRRTEFDLTLVSLGRHVGLVSVDARLPGDIVEEALGRKALSPFLDYPGIKREATFGDSRLDFLLSQRDRLCYLEVKSVTKVRGGVALFPDAVTARGSRHLHSLTQARAQGHRAAVLFLVQRQDGELFAPDDDTDPLFGQTLRQAASLGVEAYAYRCKVGREEVTIERDIPVCL